MRASGRSTVMPQTHLNVYSSSHNKSLHSYQVDIDLGVRGPVTDIQDRLEGQNGPSVERTRGSCIRFGAVAAPHEFGSCPKRRLKRSTGGAYAGARALRVRLARTWSLHVGDEFGSEYRTVFAWKTWRLIGRLAGEPCAERSDARAIGDFPQHVVKAVPLDVLPRSEHAPVGRSFGCSRRGRRSLLW